MYRLTNEDQEVLRSAVKHNVRLQKLFETWRTKELEDLPNVQGNVPMAQGRCQVLGELVRHINEALNNPAPKQ